MEITSVPTTTSVPEACNLFVIENGVLKQATIDDVLKNSSVNQSLAKLGILSTGSATVSVPTGVWTLIASLTLPAGTYEISGKCMFPYVASTTTGNDRRIILDESSSTVPSITIENCVSTSSYGSSLSAIVQDERFIYLSTEKTYDIWAYQNSGTAMSIQGRIRGLRIK